MEKLWPWIKRNGMFVFIAINILVVVGLVLFDPQMSDVDELLAASNPWWLLAAAAASVVYASFDGLAFWVVAKHMAPKQSLWAWLKIAVLGKYYNQITPFATGGQPFQVLHMTQCGLTLGQGTSLLSLRFWVSQIVIFGGGLAGLIVQGATIRHHSPVVYTAGLVGLVLSLGIPAVTMLLCIPRLQRLLLDGTLNAIEKRGWFKRGLPLFRQKAEQTLGDLQKSFQLVRERKAAIVCFLLTALVDIPAWMLIPYCVYRALGQQGVNLLEMMLTTNVLYLALSYMPLPGGSGAAEGGFYFLFTLYFPRALISPALLLWRIFTYHLIVLGGGGLLVSEAIGRSLQRRKAAAQRKGESA